MKKRASNGFTMIEIVIVIVIAGIITFHPAFLMRQPAQKKYAWIDLKMIRDKKTKLKI